MITKYVITMVRDIGAGSGVRQALHLKYLNLTLCCLE